MTAETTMTAEDLMMENDLWVMGKGWAGHDKGTDDTNDDEQKRMMEIMMMVIRSAMYLNDFFLSNRKSVYGVWLPCNSPMAVHAAQRWLQSAVTAPTGANASATRSTPSPW